MNPQIIQDPSQDYYHLIIDNKRVHTYTDRHHADIAVTAIIMYKDHLYNQQTTIKTEQPTLDV